MNRTSWRMAALGLALALTLAGGIEASQHQQHHPGGKQASEAQAEDTSPGMPEQGQMMGPMQGMMKNMQGMMKNMQGMMGMMGRGGMMGMAADDDDADMPRGGMMGHEAMMGRRGMMGHGGKLLRHLERVAQQLDLTDEQAAQVRSLVHAHMKEAIRAKADIDVNRLDLRELLDAASADLPKVKALLQTIASQQADLHFAHIALRQEVDKLLTPEQQKKFHTMRRRMMQGREGMMGRGGMMGPGGMQGRGGMMGPGAGTQ